MPRTIKNDRGGELRPFEPGESGNPNGRPKGSRNIATVLREYLELEDKQAGGSGDALNPLAAELCRLILKAKNESVRLKAVQEAFERIEGKVDENINLKQELPTFRIIPDAD